MKRFWKRTAGGVLALCMVLALGACQQDAPSASPSDTVSPTPSSSAPEGVSGIFSASAQGYGGDVTVTLTLENGVLTNVDAQGPDETEGVGSNALDLMPPAMVAANSVEVDGVSGATFTSDAILAAAKDALPQSGATLETQTVAVEQHMTPGTYYGEAYGKWKEGTIEGNRFGSPAVISPTRVAVTVDETSILSVEVESCDDTPGFIEVPMEQIPADIVEHRVSPWTRWRAPP